MHHKNLRSEGKQAVAMILAIALTLLAACGSSPQTIADINDTDPDQNDDTDAEIDAIPDTDPDQNDDTDAIAMIDVYTDTTWQEVFDTFTASQQSCIRDWLGDDTFESVMQQTVAIGEGGRELWEGTELWEIAIASCLDPNTARRLLLSVVVGSIAEEVPGAWVELSEDERECLWERVAEIDVALMLTAFNFGDPLVDLSWELLACLPDLLLNAIAAVTGLDVSQFSDDERECVREWVTNLDEDDIMVMLAQEDDAAAAALGLTLIACVPNLLTQGMAGPVPMTTECNTIANAVNVQDDHADAIGDATPLKVGEAADGTIDHDVDFDFFVFKAKADESYRIDVAPGTMRDPVVSLCDGEEALDYSDDYDGLAPRIYWAAPSAGPYYVKVGGWDTGTYTLTITLDGSEKTGASA